MAFDNLQEVLLTMRKNKLRTALTAFGVFWGIFMFVLLLGAGKGLENGARANSSGDNLNSIWFRGRKTTIPYKGLPLKRRIDFTESDLTSIRQQFPGVKTVSAKSSRASVTVSRKDKTAFFFVDGIADDYFLFRPSTEQRSGRKIHLIDNLQSKKVAVIGSKVEAAIFREGENPIGAYISLNGVMIKVVGVFYDAGNRGRRSERIYLPMSTYQKIFAQNDKVGDIGILPAPGVDPFKLEKRLMAHLKQNYRVSPDDNRAIFVSNNSKYAKETSDLYSAITAFSWLVGIGTLAAGIIGISNIMIITVKDRTREFGIRKALGATPLSIVSMILSESILLTTFSGYLGLVCGVAVLEAANSIFSTIESDVLRVFLNPEVDMAVAMQMLLLLVFSGAAAGFAPAIHAAKITPTAAMRAEK